MCEEKKHTHSNKFNLLPVLRLNANIYLLVLFHNTEQCRTILT